ncbi:MAG: aromatic ring-hydroxylating dioxygenase subunit alpha [Pseudomonadota bacterium]
MCAARTIDLVTEARLNAERYPHLGTGPVSTQPFISEEFLKLECEHIFAKMWLMVGRTDQVPNKGDYFTKAVECLNKRVIIARGKDGEVRAFHNVCRHRGTHVAEGAGNCKYFTCRFHGWVYDTNGDIKQIPDESQFHNLDKSTLNLRQVHCSIWKGFIFINFAEQPRESLTEQLAETGEKLADFPFESMRVAGRWGATLKANWKLFQDAFQEGYHVQTVHAGTIGKYYTGQRNPNCRPYHLDLYERNRGLSFSFNPEFEPHPSELFAIRTGQSLSQGSEGLKQEVPGINPDADPYYSFDINGIFPNWLLDTSIGFFFIHEFWPLDAITTRWEAQLYFVPPQSASQLMSQAQSIALLRDAFREDIATSEGSQAGMLSGTLDTIDFADTEITCRHQYYAVMKMIEEALAPHA